MRVALLSPYHGGSHAAWAAGVARHSRHDVRLLTLPARFWKWRMHGAAITLARELQRGDSPDVLLATDMLDLSTLLAIARRTLGAMPAVLYMHENQLTYPLPSPGHDGPMRRQGGERDRHYGFINIASMLVADRVVFNSAYHREALLDELPRFLRHFPEHREPGIVAQITGRSSVLPIGIEAAELGGDAARRDSGSPEPDAGSVDPSRAGGDAADVPLVLWNQRWEYDKNPAAFFRALERMAAEGVAFRVALCGERFGREPEAFGTGIERLADRVVHVGHLGRDEYGAMLRAADIVVSTARHEFFGIAVLEAVCAGAMPILPRRLSYPEIIPVAFHDACLYGDQAGLERRLRVALSDPGAARARARPLAGELRERYDWGAIATGYDGTLEELVAGRSALA